MRTCQVFAQTVTFAVAVLYNRNSWQGGVWQMVCDSPNLNYPICIGNHMYLNAIKETVCWYQSHSSASSSIHFIIIVTF